MTVADLRKKLEMYKDDVEIFIESYDDLCGILNYVDFNISQVEVDANKNVLGEWYYQRWGRKEKQTTVLVIS